MCPRCELRPWLCPCPELAGLAGSPLLPAESQVPQCMCVCFRPLGQSCCTPSPSKGCRGTPGLLSVPSWGSWWVSGLWKSLHAPTGLSSLWGGWRWVIRALWICKCCPSLGMSQDCRRAKPQAGDCSLTCASAGSCETICEPICRGSPPGHPTGHLEQWQGERWAPVFLPLCQDFPSSPSRPRLGWGPRCPAVRGGSLFMVVLALFGQGIARRIFGTTRRERVAAGGGVGG